jgi:hypothetical protein
MGSDKPLYFRAFTEPKVSPNTNALLWQTQGLLVHLVRPHQNGPDSTIKGRGAISAAISE